MSVLLRFYFVIVQADKYYVLAYAVDFFPRNFYIACVYERKTVVFLRHDKRDYFSAGDINFHIVNITQTPPVADVYDLSVAQVGDPAETTQ